MGIKWDLLCFNFHLKPPNRKCSKTRSEHKVDRHIIQIDKRNQTIGDSNGVSNCEATLDSSTYRLEKLEASKSRN